MDGILIVGWLACAIFAAVIASSKGRSGGAWFLLGCLFGIFALLAVGFMPAAKKEDAAAAAGPAEHPTTAAPQERKCPFCAEMIKAEAVVCRFCGHELEALPICEKCHTIKGHGTCEDCRQIRFADERAKLDAEGKLICDVCQTELGKGSCNKCLWEKAYQNAKANGKPVCDTCRTIKGEGDCDECKQQKISAQNTQKSGMRFVAGIVVLFILGLSISIYMIGNYNKQKNGISVQQNTDSRQEYSGEWRSPRMDISRALSLNNVKRCGEYYFKPHGNHAHEKIHDNEYLIYCTEDGHAWEAYRVWTEMNVVDGPFAPLTGVDLPQR